jgi:hypothetical protein
MTFKMAWMTIVFLYLSLSASVYACDFCTLYTGVLPQDRLNRFEYYQRYSRFSRILKTDLPVSPAPPIHARTAHVPAGTGQSKSEAASRESYIFHDVRYTFFSGPRLQVSAGIPYQQFREDTEGQAPRIRNGFGDANLFALYGIMVKDSLKKSIRWFAGGGLRLPTGWYYRNSEMYADYFFEQGGTGTMGYLLISSLNYRYRNMGITQMMNVRYHPATSRSYKPGGVLNLSQQFFVMINVRYPDIRLVPSLSLYLEAFDGNRYEGFTVMNTGGFASFAGPDVSIYFNRLSVRAAWVLPIVEKLNGAPFTSESRMQFGIMYTFGKTPC